jgi:GT2 family glycosyltransferase
MNKGIREMAQLTVLGAGLAGLAAAGRAAHLGMHVETYEKNTHVGGQNTNGQVYERNKCNRLRERMSEDGLMISKQEWRGWSNTLESPERQKNVRAPTELPGSSECPEYTIIIPTYKRADVLEMCLEHIGRLAYSLNHIEVLVLDNGAKENTASVGEPFLQQLPLIYIVNDRTHGMGYSINKGLGLAKGKKIVIMNDDALLPASFLNDCDSLFKADPSVGCIGCRAIEKGYVHIGTGIGRIDDSGEIVGNFDQVGDQVVEVDHVYGFCYVFTQEALQKAGPYDKTLLAKDYSSGNRNETDHCLSIKRKGFKIVYDPRIAVEHLAKPRADFNERSLKWKLNHTRNTLYLFLKHYGLFGKKCLALRFTFLQDVGIVSTLKKPTLANIRYFVWGLRARLSAFGHYALYLVGR